MKSSIRGINWDLFAATVKTHITEYTVPQYGDYPNDQVTPWTAEDCVKAIRKYAARFGTGQRGQKDALMDMIKIAHYASMAYEKMENEK